MRVMERGDRWPDSGDRQRHRDRRVVLHGKGGIGGGSAIVRGSVRQMGGFKDEMETVEVDIVHGKEA